MMRSLSVFVAVLIVISAAWFFLLRPDGPASDGVAVTTPASSETTVAEEEPLPEPITLTTRVDEIVNLYETAPWVHRGDTGPVLYVISFRSCPTCLAFKEAELHGLEDAGVDVRWIIYARRDREGRERSSAAERAVQAELWLSRDWDLFADWYAVDPATYYATAELPPAADEDPARAAAVEDARALVERLSDLYAENGVDLYIPSLLWQEDGTWKTYVGYDEQTFAPVRAALTGE
jgi:hypothetical protein